MALVAMYFTAVLVGGTAAQQDGSSLLQVSVRSFGQEQLTFMYDTFTEGAFSHMPADAPLWCKNDTLLSWKQRKERMLQHATLQWAKKMMKQLLEENSTVPEWMNTMVSDDEKRGKTKWAVLEARRLKEEGKTIPQWMADLVEEDAKWANRWAACKSAEIKAAGEEVPAWMLANGRRGILDAAKERAAELREQLQELDKERQQETALVDAHGDFALAKDRIFMSGRTKLFDTTSLSQQFQVLELAVEELDSAEDEMLHFPEIKSFRRMRRALPLVKSVLEEFNRLLEARSLLLLEQLENRSVSDAPSGSSSSRVSV